MTQEESNKLAKLLARKEKADKLPTDDRLKYIDKYMDIIAEILEIQEQEESKDKPFDILPLNLAAAFTYGLPYTNDSIEQYVWDRFKELGAELKVEKILWKLKAAQETSYKLKEELK